MAPVMVKRAEDVDPARDAVLCMPGPARPGGNVRIPVRSSWIEGGYLQYEPGSRSVVAAAAAGRLRHLVLSFPAGCFCHGLRSFDAAAVVLSFALYEPRSAAAAGGPPAAALRALGRLDALSDFLATASVGCDALRRAAGLAAAAGPAAREPTLSVVRPEGGGAVRYCCTKVSIGPEPGGAGPPRPPATVFLAPSGAAVPLARVREWRNFRVDPYVHVDEIFVSGGRRSLQLRLRECVVYPPCAAPVAAPEVRGGRPSAAFPGQRCGGADDGAPAESGDDDEPAAALAKRPRRD